MVTAKLLSDTIRKRSPDRKALVWGKLRCFWTMVLEKTLENPLDYKEIQPVNPKGNQSWIFIGRTGAEAKTPIVWPPTAKNWLNGKDSNAGKDWRQEEKGITKDEMVWWPHQLDGHEFEQAPGVGDGQGGPMLQSLGWQRLGHDWATELNWRIKGGIWQRTQKEKPPKRRNS